MPRQRAIVLVCAILIAAGLNNCSSDDHTTYRAEINVDTVVVAETLITGSHALVKFTIPGGCNRLPQAEITSRADTLRCIVTVEFYDPGVPCAHGPIRDSLSVEIRPAQYGDYKLVYRHTDSANVVLPIRVLGPI